MDNTCTTSLSDFEQYPLTISGLDQGHTILDEELVTPSTFDVPWREGVFSGEMVEY
jgi:hypothetical protein